MNALALAAAVVFIVLVDDAYTRAAMRAIHRHLGLVVEPSGAVGVGAIMAHPHRFRGLRIATILCGGNMTAGQMRARLADPDGSVTA